MIQECDIDIRREILKNIVLSGGTTLFPGFASRIERELKMKSYEKFKEFRTRLLRIPIDVYDNQKRKYLHFIGATVLININNNNYRHEYWITKQEWEEVGFNIIFKKCKDKIQVNN